MVLTFSSFPSTDNPLTNQMPNSTIANRQYLHSNSMLCSNLKRKTYQLASSSEKVLTCKPRCKLHRAAFEEAFVEDGRIWVLGLTPNPPRLHTPPHPMLPTIVLHYKKWYSTYSFLICSIFSAKLVEIVAPSSNESQRE